MSSELDIYGGARPTSKIICRAIKVALIYGNVHGGGEKFRRLIIYIELLDTRKRDTSMATTTNITTINVNREKRYVTILVKQREEPVAKSITNFYAFTVKFRRVEEKSAHVVAFQRSSSPLRVSSTGCCGCYDFSTRSNIRCITPRKEGKGEPT